MWYSVLGSSYNAHQDCVTSWGNLVWLNILAGLWRLFFADLFDSFGCLGKNLLLLYGSLDSKNMKNEIQFFGNTRADTTCADSRHASHWALPGGTWECSMARRLWIGFWKIRVEDFGGGCRTQFDTACKLEHPKQKITSASGQIHALRAIEHWRLEHGNAHWLAGHEFMTCLQEKTFKKYITFSNFEKILCRDFDGGGCKTNTKDPGP